MHTLTLSNDEVELLVSALLATFLQDTPRREFHRSFVKLAPQQLEMSLATKVLALMEEVNSSGSRQFQA